MNIMGYNYTSAEPQLRLVCRYYQRGMCRFGQRCRNIHEKSEHTNLQKVNENTTEENKTTILEESEDTSSSGTSLSSSVPNSSSVVETLPTVIKTCGICFDSIIEKKETRDQVYGILPNCNHCFCFSCIRKWRQSKEFDFDVSKACPECRVASNYVYPSKDWFEDKEEKDNFISRENLRMQQFDCRYFRKGVGTCPFGNTCVYRHALPNGKKMDVGPPKPRRPRTDTDQDLANQILYWLNDEDDLDLDDDDDDEFDLDLSDPLIAMQYYDHDDIRRYIAIERLLNPTSDTDSDEYDLPLYI